MKKNDANKVPLNVKIERTDEKLTSQVGLIPVVKFLYRIGLEEVVDRRVGHSRGTTAVYKLSEVVSLVTVGIIAGARSLLGVVSVWADSVLRQIAGWFRIPDDSTLGRIFKELEEREIVELEAVNHILRSRVWKMGLENGKSKVGAFQKLWIDVDSTVKTVYGKQEGAEKGYNPSKRGAFSYHPLLAFCEHTKEILQGWLRCGSAYTSNGIVGFMGELLAYLDEDMQIVFRADSGFFNGELLEFLESRRHSYLIKVKMKGLIELLESQNWGTVAGQMGWEESKFEYRCKEWGKTRCFVAVRIRRENEENRKGKSKERNLEGTGYDYFCYVTTEDFTPWQVHKKYGARATWIEEAKNQMALGHIKTESFVANAAIFQCAILAYNAVKWMALLSGDNTLLRWEIQTIRAFLIRIAAKLIRGGRQYTLKVPQNQLFGRQFDVWLEVGY